MSQAIKLSAYWEMCPDCGLHGCIVLSDGSKTRDFRFKESGLAAIRLLREANRIDDSESKFLSQTLNDSDAIRRDHFDETPFTIQEVFFCLDEDGEEPPAQSVTIH